MRGEACLNNAQRVFLAVYMPAAVLILVLDNLFTGESVVQYVKYSTYGHSVFCAVPM